MLLGLHGPAKSGKDTVYGMLRTLSFEGPLTSYIVRRDAFADRLKLSLGRTLGFIEETDAEVIDLMNMLKQPGGQIQTFIPTSPDGTGGIGKTISGREGSQYKGTEGGRDIFGWDHWVKLVLPDGYPSAVEQEKTLLVITDVRFPNEAERVRECGGEVWKIDRPQEEIAESDHVSEQPLPSELIDYTIKNHAGLDELLDEVKTAIEELLTCSG